MGGWKSGAKREHQILQTPTSSEPLTPQMLGVPEVGGTDPVMPKMMSEALRDTVKRLEPSLFVPRASRPCAPLCLECRPHSPLTAALLLGTSEQGLHSQARLPTLSAMSWLPSLSFEEASLESLLEVRMFSAHSVLCPAQSQAQRPVRRRPYFKAKSSGLWIRALNLRR